MNRREFLQLLGMAGAGVVIAPAAVATAAVAVSESVPVKLMYDGRYAIAREHAKELGKKGIASIDTGGDVIGLWFQDSEAFRLVPGQLMQGYTAWSDFQALRGLIDDVRLGRDMRTGCPTRLLLLQRDSNENRTEGSTPSCALPFNREEPVYLVKWLAFG